MFGDKPHTIKVTLKSDGKIETLVEGIQGPSCEEATKWLEELGTTVEHGSTPDFDAIDTQGVGIVSEF